MQRRPRRQNPKHLKWIAGRPCVLCGYTPSDAAHIKMADARIMKPITGNQSKADDRFTLPLCRIHHEQQHRIGERQFWNSYHIDPVLLSLAMFSITGDDQEGDRLMTITSAVTKYNQS